MHEQLLQALVASKNEAADDVLLEGLRLGVEVEKAVMLDALMSRKTTRGLSGVISYYENLPPRLQGHVLRHIKIFHHALRESGRSDRPELRLASMRLIALGREGKLAYVISENLHDSQEELSKAAVEAILSLAKWVSDTTRDLQDHYPPFEDGPAVEGSPAAVFATRFREIMEQRPEIETAVARALDVHRGKQTQELLRASLLLADSPRSKTLAILQTTKHGGQSMMVRRLQQPPNAETVDAFLLGATHGQLRLHFGTVFSHITEPPVLSAILRKTHWLKDHQLQLCMHQVTRGAWWQEVDLIRDIQNRPGPEAAIIGEWLAVSGSHDLMQDERHDAPGGTLQDRLRGAAAVAAHCLAAQRGSSVQFLRVMLSDADERLMRLAAREIVRRRPPEADNMLLQLMTNAPESVRRVISRSIGQAGFEHFWARYDRLDRATRKQAGKAMMKLLPDAVQRLSRRLAAGPVEQRIKALQMTQELDLADQLREPLAALASHPHPKVRSKAVTVLGDMETASIEVLMDRALSDPDSRVRANAVEILEMRPAVQFVPLLMERAKNSHNRERANAIKALHRMKVGNVGPQLIEMLHDQRAEHRISAMWALKQMGWWKLLQEVGQLAKEDNNLRVRRYAVGVLKGVADMVQEKNKEKAG